MRSKRLQSGDRGIARELFAVMAEVFDEERGALSDAYLDRLLAREDFWAIAVYDDDRIIGGITAHTLPMTATASSELFIYDIAVRRDYQRTGVGRHLITALRKSAAELGIKVMFVAADNADEHAIEFYRALGGKASPVSVFTFGPDAE